MLCNCQGNRKIPRCLFRTKAVGAEKTVTNYLGLALLPQGRSQWIICNCSPAITPVSVAITTIIMFSNIYEVSGPIFAKIAIDKAGEIGGACNEETSMLKMSNCARTNLI